MDLTDWGFDPPESRVDDWLDGRTLRQILREVVIERLAGSGLPAAQGSPTPPTTDIYATEGWGPSLSDPSAGATA